MLKPNFLRRIQFEDCSFRILLYFLIVLPLSFFAEVVYVAGSSSNDVSIIDIISQSVINTIPVNTLPSRVTFTPDGSVVYVSNESSNRISVINVTSQSVITTIPVGIAPRGVAFTPDGSMAYVANLSHEVSVINVASQSVTNTIPVGMAPREISCSPDGSTVYVSNNQSDNISVIDVASQSVINTIPVGIAPQGIACTPDGGMVYVCNNQNNNISVIDVASQSVINTIPTGSNPRFITFNPDGSLIYIIFPTANANISVIDVASQSVINTIPVGTSLQGFAFSPDGSMLYVSSNSTDTVSVIDITNQSVTNTIPITTNPLGIASTISYINYLVDADGSWGTTTNWSPQIPPDNPSLQFENARAQFLNLNTAPRTVTIDNTITIDGIRFISDQAYTVAADPMQELILTHSPVIAIQTGAGIHEISAPIHLLEPLRIEQTTVSDFIVSGAISGNASVSINTMGTVIFGGSNSYLGDTEIEAGTLQTNAVNTMSSSSLVNLMASGVTFDLNSNAQTIGNLSGVSGSSVALGSATLTTGVEGSDQEFGGQISGDGGIVKTGAGTLTLSGSNSYLGDTQINAGTLQIGVANTIPSASAVHLSGSAQLDLNNFNQEIADLSGTTNTMVDLGDATLSFGAAEGAHTFAGQFAGSIDSHLVKTGNGQFTVSGNSSMSYSGETTIQGGELLVSSTGNLSGSSLFIQSGATLRGTGTVGPTTIETGGTLHAGESIGTISIEGDLTLSSGSTVIVEINDLDQSTLYDVQGDAILGALESALEVIPHVGLYQGGTTWTILTTGGTISGAFAFTPPTLLPGLILVPNTTMLQLFLPSSVLIGIPTEGLSGNTLIMADYLNTLVDVPSLQDVLNDLIALPTPELISALNSISPLRTASVRFALFNTQLALSDLVSSRIANERTLRRFPSTTSLAAEALLVAAEDWVASSGKQGKPYSAWAQGFGLFAHETGKNTNPSFDAASGGFLLGFDARSESSFLLGGGAGYANVRVQQSSHLGKGFADMAVAVLYSAYSGDRFFLNWSLWGSYSRIKNRRNISFTGFNETATSASNSYGLTPHFAAGYAFWQGTFEPFISLDWPIQFNGALHEKKAAPLSMDVRSTTASMLRSEAGLNIYEKARFKRGILIARQTLSYINKAPFSVGDVTAAVVGQAGNFTVVTFQSAQNLVSPQAEVFFKWNRGVFCSLLYQGEFGSGYASNEAIGKIGINF